MGMREEFEDWACNADDGPLIDPVWMAYFDKERNEYGLSEIHRSWKIWQASRAALCVELPPELHAYTGQPQEDRLLDADRNHTIKQCRQAIESAGVKCK